jgi:hypothetical protein
MEGAVWLGKKMTNEIEKLCQIVESIVSDFHLRANEEDFNFRPALPQRGSQHFSTSSFGIGGARFSPYHKANRPQ